MKRKKIDHGQSVRIHKELVRAARIRAAFDGVTMRAVLEKPLFKDLLPKKKS